ncbi:hypothetical protein PsYK624_023530 [Phanerochaete sordida]|uniref:Uncharacterized protein n=1 Tax=Phanerochaete sordida TaxID=48140 RepID=A0A9P3G122_9APHY|nr:hypothetical protein PsYK624_023530 [Phanerochaete sordida]
MLNLSNLRGLLSQVVSPASLHTAVLFTPSGQLVSFASSPLRSKDEIRVIVGLGGEIWQETKEQGIGMVDSEIGRLVIIPVEQPTPHADGQGEAEPLMILALNGNESVSWKIMEAKARQVVGHLDKPVSELREKLAVAPVSPIGNPPRVAR